MIKASKRKIKKLLAIAEDVAADHWRIGLQWYQKASKAAELLAITHNVEKVTVCGVLAAFSVRSAWPHTIANTDLLLSGGRPKGIYQKQVTIAKRIIKHEIRPDLFPDPPGSLLGYRKTYHFFQCLLDPHNPIYAPLDHWALSPFAEHGQKAAELCNTVKKQDHYLAVYRAAAAELGILPSQLQSIVWLDRKAAAEALRAEDVDYWPIAEQSII